MNASKPSSILCHCWRHDDVDQARRVFDSICRTGLLLTTNGTRLDTFGIDRGEGVVAMEVMQAARVALRTSPLSILPIIEAGTADTAPASPAIRSLAGEVFRLGIYRTIGAQTH